MLNDRMGVKPKFNTEWTYVIDMEKGVYVDSRAMTEEQYTKYFRDMNFRTRPDLNYRQTCEFSKKYLLGERLLHYKKSQNNYAIGRLARIANHSYVMNHFEEIFGSSFAQGLIAQDIRYGFKRSDDEVQRIAEYGEKRFNNAKQLGLLPHFSAVTSREKKVEVERIANVLRDRYIPKPQAKAVEE